MDTSSRLKWPLVSLTTSFSRFRPSSDEVGWVEGEWVEGEWVEGGWRVGRWRVNG